MIIKNIRLLNSDDQIFDFKTRLFYIIDQLEEFDLRLLESISQAVKEKYNLSLIDFYYENLTTGFDSDDFIDLFLETFFKTEKNKFYDLVKDNKNYDFLDDKNNKYDFFAYRDTLLYISYFAIKDLTLLEIKKGFLNYIKTTNGISIDFLECEKSLNRIEYDFENIQEEGIVIL